jgi:UDP-N-acetylglucosamine:LPS N-acetylglucosamine transferase
MSRKGEGADVSVRREKAILAVASGGGHWLQLLRLKRAFEGHRVTFVSVNRETAADVAPARHFAVRDANRWDKVGLLVQLAKLSWIVLRVRPDVVISTGAAPGYFALRLGKLFGARTIWVDSIANAEEMSLSGRLAQRYADLWLTQWPEVAKRDGARYEGRLL